MLSKTYEEYIKEQVYQEIAQLLVNDEECRNSNAKAVKKYFRIYHNISLDEAVNRFDLPSIFTIERKVRQLKQVNPKLCGSKKKDQTPYKEIAMDIPVVTRLF